MVNIVSWLLLAGFGRLLDKAESDIERFESVN